MSKPRRKRHMTAAEFEAVRPLLKLSKDRIDAAYSALVLGDVLQLIADQYGWTRQAVNDVERIVWATFQSYKVARQAEVDALNRDLPDGWQMVSIAAPVDLIEKFQEEVTRRANK